MYAFQSTSGNLGDRAMGALWCIPACLRMFKAFAFEVSLDLWKKLGVVFET
jgi:hypothetical protein